jgi:hypothetical protein
MLFVIAHKPLALEHLGKIPNLNLRQGIVAQNTLHYLWIAKIYCNNIINKLKKAKYNRCGEKDTTNFNWLRAKE